MDNLKDDRDYDFNIIKIENKILNMFSEINKQYSIMLINLVGENISQDDKLKIEKYLSNIMKTVINIQQEIDNLTDSILATKEFVRRL